MDTREYRRDIDGLRALAVLSVVVNHLNENWLAGGFNGVDVFFVISGYLITGHIYTDLQYNRFSLKRFYERRIKRIIPALMFMLLLTYSVGFLILLPEDLKLLSEQVVASLLSVSNIYFNLSLDTSYFAPDVKETPLLHTWSLGVEEQFYLVFPLILLAASHIFKYQKSVLYVILAILLVSLGYSEMILNSDPMEGYYSIFSRAWELMLGAVVAIFLITHGAPKNKVLCNVLSCIGIVLISYAFVFVDSNAKFPGFSALFATVGTGLIIFSGFSGNSFVKQFLSIRPLVLIGLISYSLYLFHWPVFAYSRYIFGDLSGIVGLLALVLSIGLALFSYIYIETKYRRSKASFSVTVRNYVVVPFGVSCLSLFFVYSTDGNAFHIFSNSYKLVISDLDFPKSAGSHSFVYQESVLDENGLTAPSYLVNTSSEPNVLLWGDSNAAHFVGMVGEIGRELGFAFRNASHSACPPLLQNPERFVTAARRDRCKKSNDAVKKILYKYDVIFLAASYGTYSRIDGFDEELENTVKALSKNSRVVLIGQIPRLKHFDASCFKKIAKLPFLNCDSAGEPNRINTKIKNIAHKHQFVEYFDAEDVLCDKGVCSPYVNSSVAYLDAGHLTHEGSIALGTELILLGVPLFLNDIKSKDLINALPWDASYDSFLSTLKPFVSLYPNDYLNEVKAWDGFVHKVDDGLEFRDDTVDGYNDSTLREPLWIDGADFVSMRDRYLVFDLKLKSIDVNQTALLRVGKGKATTDILLKHNIVTFRGGSGAELFEIKPDLNWVNYRVAIPFENIEGKLEISLVPAVHSLAVRGYTASAEGVLLVGSASFFISRQKIGKI